MHVGLIERFKQRQPHVALGEHVDRATIVILNFFIRIPTVANRPTLPATPASRWGRTCADSIAPRNLQLRIAHRLAFQSLPARVPQQIVRRIGSPAPWPARLLRIDLRRLAIRGRQHHQSMQRLQIANRPPQIQPPANPAIPDARGFLPSRQIVRRRHNPLAEMKLPQTVHNHPRRQRMIRPRQPVGQCRTAAGGIRACLPAT